MKKKKLEKIEEMLKEVEKIITEEKSDNPSEENNKLILRREINNCIISVMYMILNKDNE
jgi:hypothetical protein